MEEGPVLLGLGEANVIIALVTHGKEQETEQITKLATDSLHIRMLHSPMHCCSVHAPATPIKAYPDSP